MLSEHTARVKDPKKYKSFTRKQVGSGIDVVYGVVNGKSEIQAYKFAAKVYTLLQAMEWLKTHNVSYMEFEPVSGFLDKSNTSKKA